ncbi:SAV_2336 N-terminal domain-related protein [Streptomyces sp. NL15-2K]|uniref:SAV_2336 N-terminal domain-related protein n=1 Tax=Streptomyces sp. NL15-2K TaxID=376149 RepID=UPI000F56FC91|nr:MULTISPECIES: SAV_2336 N-terminal domain-related protein [Actinomycetes]WKX12499.1 SAV_2336 N-terminal domain-related protein [Kutzneria buriramensis]GCB45989.1 hypothetical protein SNL152K_3285 [Streptomyces sp. NL15-2K]
MASRAPGIPADDVSDVLAALVARLRDAGLTPGVEELADALWLAHWLPAPESPPGRTPARASEATRSPADGPDPLPAGPRTTPDPADGADRQPDGARLFAPGPGEAATGVRTAPVRVPAAPALPEPLALQAGLRPLQRYRAPVRPVPRVLDERATAERAAESGLVVPVLRTERRREARLLLLMDVSTSTVVWQQALDELRQVCERAGAFREVQVHYLHEAPGGLPGWAPAPEHTGPLHAPEQLSDPTGHRVTLVLSDCAGPMWRSGHMQRLLYRWAATAPVAVVQPLPQRLWLRTHLPARRGLLRRREGPAGALEFRPDKGRVEPHALPVPVLALRRPSVESWARLVSGATGQSLAAAAGWVRADHPASTAPVRAAEDLSGEDRVRVFWRAASPQARRLAVYLSAAPLYLPVMQLVQHAMLAGSGPEVLSEVLLSGLLRRREDADDPRAVRYDFLPGVATELRARLAVEEVELLFKHCSEYVERKFGRSVRNFPALAGAFLRGVVDPERDSATPLSGLAQEEPAGLRAFAEVSAEVLRDLGARIPVVPSWPGANAGELLSRGRAALERYRNEGLTRELDAAVDCLRKALEAARPGQERTGAAEELANALLSRWRVRSVVEDLRDALAVLEGVGTRRAVLLRGTVLANWAAGLDGATELPDGVRRRAEARADTERTVLRWAFHEMIERADAELTIALGDESAEGPDLALRTSAARLLLGVRRALAASGAQLPLPGPEGEPHTWYVRHMNRAVEAATVWLSLADPEQAHLERGRLLLALARQYLGQGLVSRLPQDGDRERANEAAGQAADDFVEAVHTDEALSDAERCGAWLDMASATELIRPARADDPQRELVLYAVQQALSAAGEDEELRFTCHAWAARMHRARYDETGSDRDIDRCVDAWQAAVPLLDEDDGRRPGVLTEYGTALLDRGKELAAAADIENAVRVLRSAVEDTPEADDDLAVRRTHLGFAYALRYEHSRVLSDLYEADWILGEVARNADAPHIVLAALFQRGLIATETYERSGTLSHLHRAAEIYQDAVETALEVGDQEGAADARQQRGAVFERLNHLRTALREYREALDLTADPARGEDLRTRIARLETGTAAE